MNLKDLPYAKFKYEKGETFYQRIGEALLTDGRATAVDSRRVSPSAVARRNGNTVELVLFDTKVAVFHKTGSMTLQSGGWRTRYTREQLNLLLPKGLYLSSVAGVWVLQNMSKGNHPAEGFQECCVIHEDGTTASTMKPAQLKELRDLIAKSKRYVRRYVDHLLDGKVASPGPGDCLYCQVEAGSSQAVVGVLLPDGTERPHTPEELGDHVRSHINEGYFVPSMLWNAVNQQGGPDFVRWSGRLVLQWLWTQQGKARPNDLVTAETFQHYRVAAGTDLRSVLTNYVRRKIGCEFRGMGWQKRPK
jgi:hypothetical protein